MAVQATNRVLMIRPANFGYNYETEKDNAFQNEKAVSKHKDANAKARVEFDLFVKKLRAAGVKVDIWHENDRLVNTDSIFPNNWVSFHQDNSLAIYPMNAPTRRKERDPKIIDWIRTKYRVEKMVDFTTYEKENIFLEGTGSLILDRVKKVAYACLSPRTNKRLLNRFCKRFGYKKHVFSAVDQNGMDIYHTNVMMTMGDSFVVICKESVAKKKERKALIKQLKKNKKDIITISWKQMNRFAGNMLLLKGKKDKNIIVMSKRAYKSLALKQIKQLERHGKILYSNIKTIEDLGGGSVRCMLAEVFLDLKFA